MSKASIGKARSTHKVSTPLPLKAQPRRSARTPSTYARGEVIRRKASSDRDEQLRKHAEGMPEIRRPRFEHRRVTWRARRALWTANTSHVHPASPGARYTVTRWVSNNGERTRVGHDPLRDPRAWTGPDVAAAM
jgi:hypothetical protein